MPFAMTHLHIAYNILRDTPQIKKPCDFMLGALAPDSIHIRENYVSEMKKISHLCVGNEKWGRATNNQEWLENVLAFLREYKHTDKADFIYGYCSHIFADIQNNIKIWTPFRLENKENLEKGMGSVYHKEARDVDYVLYLLQPQQKIIWEMLKNSVAYDIPNVIVGNEINQMKYSILHSRFNDRESVDVSSNKYVTLSNQQEFISVESQYIKKLLYHND
ncbi:MAG: hypothetical protein FH753_12695 [Firmicutes bacterium]|nr:hypothetical protein [Bacillota bacterium]